MGSELQLRKSEVIPARTAKIEVSGTGVCQSRQCQEVAAC